MCFSASASFVAGATLMIVGTTSIKKAKEPRLLPFASIPLIFGVQQITEGFVWLSLQNTDFEHWKHPATLSFLIFAQVVWPALVPISMRIMEEKQVRKTALSIISMIGIGVAAYLAYGIFFFPVDVNEKTFHIEYELSSQKQMLFNSQPFYVTATVISAFVSSRKGMLLYGSTILLSMIVSVVYFNQFVISVWCFFASLLSVIGLYVIIKAKNN
jgi:drug/metabolite transporter (DMT)-like permease